MLGYVPELGGRTLVAEAHGYKKGQLILAEEPHIVFPATSKSQIYQKVRVICKLSLHDESVVDDLALAIAAYIETLQDADVSDYFATSTAVTTIAESCAAGRDGQEGGSELREIGYEKLWKMLPKYYEVDIEALKQFAMTMICNAHRTSEKVLLYRLVSKMAHSCDPNTLLLIKTKQADGKPGTQEGLCSVIATRDIGPGEPLTFSYFSGQPGAINGAFGRRNLRRRHLLETKFFLCKCSRCIQEEAVEIEEDCGRKLEGAELQDPDDGIRRVHSCYNAMDNYNIWIRNFPDLESALSEGDESPWTSEQFVLICFGLAYKYLVALPNLYHWGIVVSEKKLGPGFSFLHRGLSLTSQSTKLTMCVVLGIILPVCRAIGQSITTLPKGFKFIGPIADDAAQTIVLLRSVLEAEDPVLRYAVPDYHHDVSEFKNAVDIYLP